ncbi:MAG: Vacuolar protein sorting-associated protein 4B [Ramalina farinacea]|uniref:Vacuolar protein sorting-associated protein 4B n=1 Tax=Ramalina farinacea TaxID=258253 RepID=A0AA43QQK8_9LECA|nr:Vacuolar protein sorting-associated protein 4B [Ramalina farinacea]
MSLAAPSSKRAGDDHDEGDKGDGRRVAQKMVAGSSSGQQPEGQGFELPPALRLTADPTKLKPEQLLEYISGMTHLRYARDLMKVFAAEEISADVFQMRQLWLTVRKVSSDEMMGHGQKPSGFKQILEGVATMHDLCQKLEQTKASAMYRYVSMVFFDYVMLLYIDSDMRDIADAKIAERSFKAKHKANPTRNNSNKLEMVRSHELDFDKLFNFLTKFLTEVASPRGPASRLIPTMESQRHEDPSIPQADREQINLIKIDKGTQAMGLDRIAGYTKEKSLLNNAINEVINTPHLTERAGTSNGVLLFGPPGTGKTSMTTLVAGGFDKCTVYRAFCSQLFSKWVGGPERTVKALFAVANENRPAVIIFDEIDALCSNRESDDGGGTKRFAAELLQQMTAYTGVVVIGTTNLPWVMDSAFERRFSNHIHVGLPDRKTRYELFKLILDSYLNVLGEAEFGRLADNTEHYSGSLIRTIVTNTAREVASQARKVTHFRKIKFKGRDCYVVCSPSDRGAEKRTYESVSQQLEPGPLTLRMLRDTIEHGHGLKRPDQETVMKCLQWDRQNGRG